MANSWSHSRYRINDTRMKISLDLYTIRPMGPLWFTGEHQIGGPKLATTQYSPDIEML